MKVVEVLNALPGESFIHQHAKAVLRHTNISLSWAFCQTDYVGKLSPPFTGLTECIGLINPNRVSRFQKITAKIRYFNSPDSYTKTFEHQLRQLKPDLIHFHFASLAVRHIKLMSRMQIPFTFSVRGSDVQIDPIVYGESYIKQLTETSSLAAGIHTVTDDLRNTLFQYSGRNEKTSVIRTCIDESWTSISRKPQRSLLISVGRLNSRKGFPDLLLACKILKEYRVDFKLIIIGEGPERALLEFMIKDLKLESQVTLAGNKTHNELRHYFAEAHAFVLSSLAEGFPNVLAEAMLAKVPIVSTNLKGVVEIVTDGVTGELAESGNPESLAKAIIRVLELSSDSLVNRSVAAFRVAGNEFGFGKHAEAFKEFWSSALEQS